MFNRIFSIKSGLQIVSFLSLVALVLVIARLIHHQTENALAPFLTYLSSIEIAFPPLLILAVTYGMAFLSGKALSDVPGAVVSFFRNKYFQSSPMMIWSATLIVVAAFFSLKFTETNPAPAYRDLVSALLSGEIDNSEQTKKLIGSLQERNPTFAEQVALVQQVFDLRRGTNLDSETSILARARLLLRALNNASDPEWRDHPLRKHGLAEAYSLLAGEISRAGDIGERFGELNPIQLYREAIKHYEFVRDESPSKLATRQLLASAQNNIGNAYYYQGNPKSALIAWEKIITDFPDQRNVGTLANMVAAHIVLGELENAVLFGEEAQLWAETNGKAIQDTAHYASILINTGFAHIGLDDMTSARPLFEFADLVQGDDNTHLNVAMIYAMQGEANRAETALRQIGSPVSYTEISETLDLAENERCSFLWWALHSDDTDPRDVAASLLVFLNERHSPLEMQKYLDPSELQTLRGRVATSLGNFPGTCASYSLFPTIVDFVRGN